MNEYKAEETGSCWKVAFIYLAVPDLSCCMWDLVP